MSLFKDLFRRLRLGWRWVAAQFVVTALLLLAGVGWTRLPDKHLWQVAFSLLVPVLLAISALELQAGTVRSFADNDGKRVKLVWGALSLLVWIAIGAAAWAVLDWCDDQIPQWAGYLNSQAEAHARAKLFTYEHIYLWITYVEWVFRWVIVPAKIIPYAVASAQWGWRLPWRRVIRLLWNWRWWLGVVLAALLTVELPSHFFAAEPSGSVHAQVWRVVLKLIVTYLLAVGSWVLLLGWLAVLFGRQQPCAELEGIPELFKRLHKSRGWIGAQFGWMLVFCLANSAVTRIPNDLSWKPWLKVPLMLLLLLAMLVAVAGTLRSLLSDGGKRVRLVWGTLALLIWVVLLLVAVILVETSKSQIAQWLLSWVVIPALIVPWAAGSALRGLRLPWRRILRLLANWRWWLGVMIASLVRELVDLFVTHVVVNLTWVAELKLGVASLLEMGIWILLLGWLAVLFGRQQPPAEEVLAAVLARVGPPEPDKQA
jgi:hypothetical protein